MAKAKTKVKKIKKKPATPKGAKAGDDVFARVSKIIAGQIKKSPSDITRGASLQNDLGADSLDAMEIVFQLEEEFGIKISEEEANKIATVSDIVSAVQKKNKT